MPAEVTSIKVKRVVLERIHALKEPGESCNDVIARLCALQERDPTAATV